jgi:cyclopropane-fatty-acyl-phospholipid synthase
MERLSSTVMRRVIGVLANKAVYGPLVIGLPDGDEIVIQGKERAVPEAAGARIDLRRARGASRMALGGAMGFGQGYVDGDWDSPDLAAVFALVTQNEEALDNGVREFTPASLLNRIRHIRHLARPNTRTGSRRNIAQHYDLGNGFYRLWLDNEMTYSSALFADPANPVERLEDAQRAKYRRLAEALELKPGMHVLEIGCGWGGFAETAAREFGCRVTAITVSQAQFEYARARIARAGLEGQVEIRFEDYRDVRGTYDRIASIEMMEAVGERYWPQYLRGIEERLAPGGRAGIQVITIEDKRYPAYRRSADFIQTYIFPGGMLPSPKALEDVTRRCGFAIEDTFTFGLSYAETLAQWRQRFEAAWPKIAPLGFDDRFRRIWRYYLAYSEAGFRFGAIDVGQFVLRRQTD